MLTADYLGMLMADAHMRHDLLEQDSMSDPGGSSQKFFGIAGGCIDAPDVMAAGSTYWHKFMSYEGGTDMPSTTRRG